MLNATSAQQFEECWAIRKAVEAEIRRIRQQVGEALLDSIAEHRTTVNPEQVATTAKFAAPLLEFFETIQPGLIAMIGTMPSEGGDPLLEKILAVEVDISGLIQKKVARIRHRLAEYDKELNSETAAPVEPQKERGFDRFAPGPTAGLLVEAVLVHSP